MNSVVDYINRAYELAFESGWEQAWDRVVPWDRSTHILTVTRPVNAVKAAVKLRRYVKGRTVLEVGAGVGLLASELSKHTKLTVAVELDPLWAYGYYKYVYPTVLRDRRPLLFLVGDAFTLERLNARFDIGLYVGLSQAREFLELLGKLSNRVIHLTPTTVFVGDKFHEDFKLEVKQG
ncbi:MAG: hypothetical protein F7B59_04855 [Desulfurococcales archaeon]|nr:hypothetical protein [Desulfurococcales archaeon]